MTKNIFEEEEPLTPTMASSRYFINSRLHSWNIRKVLIIIGLLFFFIFGGYYFFFKVIKTPKTYSGTYSSSEQSRKSAKPGSNGAVNVADNIYINMDQMLVNLARSGDKPHYLKIVLTLQLSSENESAEVNAKLPMVVDSFQIFLRELRVTDFGSTGGMQHIKEELIKRVNKITYPIEVRDVLFKELVIN